MQNKKLWIAFGVVIALCLCLGIVGFFLVREMGNRFTDSVKTDPLVVEQTGAGIADYTLPEGYTHQMAMSILGYDFVVIMPEDVNDGMIIMLAQFSQAYMQNSNPQSFQEQMQRSFEQQSGRRGLNMEVVEVKTMTIRGEEVEVTILEGSDESGIRIRQLLTSFTSKGGMGMIMIQGDTDSWDQDAVDAFLESIH